MTYRSTLLSISGFLVMCPAALCQGASFPCERASSRVEKLICADASLSSLDVALAAAYRQMMDDPTHPVEQQRQEVKKSQREWLKRRDACQDASCAAAAMRDRLADLIQTSNLPVASSQIASHMTGTSSEAVPIVASDVQATSSASPNLAESNGDEGTSAVESSPGAIVSRAAVASPTTPPSDQVPQKDVSTSSVSSSPGQTVTSSVNDRSGEPVPAKERASGRSTPLSGDVPVLDRLLRAIFSLSGSWATAVFFLTLFAILFFIIWLRDKLYAVLGGGDFATALLFPNRKRSFYRVEYQKSDSKWKIVCLRNTDSSAIAKAQRTRKRLPNAQSVRVVQMFGNARLDVVWDG